MFHWEFEKIVELYEVEEKNSGYSSYQHGRIKDDKYDFLYMKQNVDDEYSHIIDHEYVWQSGDDYSGYMLYPLNNGKHIKIYYNC